MREISTCSASSDDTFFMNIRPHRTSVCGLKLLVYEALSQLCMRPFATSVCGLKLLGICQKDAASKEAKTTDLADTITHTRHRSQHVHFMNR